MGRKGIINIRRRKLKKKLGQDQKEAGLTLPQKHTCRFGEIGRGG
jgi:hypothetical protein